jgi:hypothetical protein
LENFAAQWVRVSVAKLGMMPGWKRVGVIVERSVWSVCFWKAWAEVSQGFVHLKMDLSAFQDAVVIFIKPPDSHRLSLCFES